MRPIELTLSLLAIITSLTLFLSNLPALWKSKILPIILGLAALAQMYPGGIPLAALALIHCSADNHHPGSHPVKRQGQEPPGRPGCPPGIDLNRGSSDFPRS